MKTIAITQRVTEESRYIERRDALDQRWASFLANIGMRLLPVPNCAPDIIAWIDHFSPDGLIMSGGNDIGSLPSATQVAPERDRTEEKLIEYFSYQKLPTIGVCRGMQMLAISNGLPLTELKGHIALRHRLQRVSHNGDFGVPSEVNSFHRYGLKEVSTTSGFEILARTEDGSVEAFVNPVLKQLGIMWHPEREAEFQSEDLELFRSFLGAR